MVDEVGDQAGLEGAGLHMARGAAADTSRLSGRTNLIAPHAHVPAGRRVVGGQHRGLQAAGMLQPVLIHLVGMTAGRCASPGQTLRTVTSTCTTRPWDSMNSSPRRTPGRLAAPWMVNLDGSWAVLEGTTDASHPYLGRGEGDLVALVVR